MSRGRKQRHDGNGDGHSKPPPREAAAPVSTPTDLVPLVRAAQELFSTLISLCAAQSTAAQVHSSPVSPPKPKYYTEEEVVEITGMSAEWFQRARREKIGPRAVGIARNVRYPHADLVQWIESGTAAREHLSSRGPKPGKKRERADSSAHGGDGMTASTHLDAGVKEDGG